MKSDNLSESLSSLRSKTNAYLEKLNTVSHEIKCLEATLQSMDIGVTSSIEIGATQPLLPTEKQFVSVRPIPHWQFVHAYAKEFLSWDRDEQSGRYRLIYCRSIFEDRVATGGGDAPSGVFTSNAYGCHSFPDGEVFRKPLIECSIDVRLRAWPRLNALVKAVDESLSNLLEHASSSDGGAANV